MLKKINKYLFGNLISIPLYASRTSEGGKKLREIFSYLPITDIAVDVENAAYNPTGKNIAAAGITGAMNFLGAKYLRYLTKGSKEVKQLAKLAKDKYNELLKLYKENLKSLVRSRSTREEALRLRQQASDAFSDYNTYNKIGSTVLAPEYFLYSIWPALDAGINTVLNQKQGGMLELLKKGSGIHIKKENKGKFTDYCGGKVTSTCIAKGKNSSDPAVRKRATFADNARKWKHKSGGKAFINGVNVLDSNPKAYKYVKKKYKMAQLGTKLQKIGSGIEKAFNSDLGKALINGIPSLISSNNVINGYGDTAKALIDRDIADKGLEVRQNSIQLADLIINNSFDPENPNSMGGDAVKGFITNNILNSNMAGLELEAKNQKAQIDIENQQLKNQATSLFLGNIGNLTTDYIASKALSKNGTPSDKLKLTYFNIKKFGIV